MCQNLITAFALLKIYIHVCLLHTNFESLIVLRRAAISMCGPVETLLPTVAIRSNNIIPLLFNA